MVELLTPNEKIRDLTVARRQIPIEVESSDVFEAILVMWTTFDPHQENRSHDLGDSFHEKVKELTPADLIEEILALGGPYCGIWLGIAGLLETAPHPHEAEKMIEWLGQLPGTRLRRWLLGYQCHSGKPSAIEEAATGDEQALRELFGEKKDSNYVDEMVAFFSRPADELPAALSNTLGRFYSEVMPELDIDFSGIIERAATARNAAATAGEDAKTVIEDVTKGLNYDIPLGVTRVVLIPSVVTRPLSVIDQHRDTLHVYYGVADEFVDSDPEAPPSWLVKTYKALSDERRLRILRRLSEGDTSLEELTEMLGLSKSTVHHHISILRGAGLVRISLSLDEGNKHKQRIYSLRDQALGDATGFLDTYLRFEEKETQHA